MNQKKLNNITDVISKQGQNVVQGNAYDLIQLWKSWYRGNVNKFHRYTEKGVNGKSREREKLTFNMPKRIAEEWSSILWNEKVKIKTNNDAINKQLDYVFENNSFRVETGNLIEKVFGYVGIGAMVEYLSEGETIIDYISGEYVIVTQGKGTQASGIITINELEENDKHITHLTYHMLEGDKYIVEHQAYVSNNDTTLGKRNSEALLAVFDQKTIDTMRTEIVEDGKIVDVKYLFIYDTTIPFFQLIRPNITNNYDTNSIMGIPVIANSIDVYKSIDNAYTSLDYESVYNKTVTVFADKASKEKATTNPSTSETSYVRYVDENNFSYISSPMSDSEEWVKRYKSEFVAQPLIDTINRHISYAAFKAGLGTKYWGFDGSTVYMNELSVVSDNNDLWKNKTKHELILGKALRDLVRAITFLEQSQGRMPQVDIDSLEIEIKFDDSIIQDDEKMKQNSLELVKLGAKAMWEHLVDWEGKTEPEAKQSVQNAIEESQMRTNSFFNEIVEDEADESTSEE